MSSSNSDHRAVDPAEPSLAQREPTSAEAGGSAGAPESNVVRLEVWGGAALGVFIALLLLWRIAGFGIWDPWELSTADAARHLASGDGAAGDAFSFGTWLVSLGFRAFGVHEWAGRLPIALSGLLTVACAYLIGERSCDRRTGLYAALITGTTPLFIFNARTMVGAAPDFAIQSALALVAFAGLLPAARSAPAFFPAARSAPAFFPAARSAPALSNPLRGLWLSSTLLAVILAVTTRGALLGAIPPLAAATLAGFWSVEQPRTIARNAALGLLAALALGLIALILRDGIVDSADYSRWLGGHSSSSTPPTFDAVLEEVFHAFAPWSALLPLAIGRAWIGGNGIDGGTVPESAQAAQNALRNACLLWAALGYGAQTLFLSRYGHEVTFLPVVALALLVAMLLRDVERRGDGSWAMGIAAVLLTGLILRDFALYPNGVVQGMPIGSFELPKVWNPIRAWSGLLAPFALCALLGLCTDSAERFALDLRSPYRMLRQQWRRGLACKVWLVVAALALVALCVLGVLAYAIPARLHMPTLALKWSRRALFTPVILALLLATAQVLLYAFSRFAAFRFLPLLAVGCATGAYAAQGFLPGLSEHFSPRDVYSSYNALARANQPLGEYHVSGRAAAYYAKGRVVELTSIGQLVDHLSEAGQRWAAFPSEELAEIDSAYRKRTHRHLQLVDARSSRVVLVASQAVAGKPDANYLRDAVRAAVPDKLQHAVSVNFDDRIELVGYDLDLPHTTYVGAGESFQITWYFRVQQRVASGYKIFVHIDGQGQRIHGDHDPVDGKYPVQLWEPGDVIADKQKLDVPASYRGGEYTVLMGFYSGDSRLPIKQGPTDGDDNRARVGVLRIQ